jgi:hypothetical protein
MKPWRDYGGFPMFYVSWADLGDKKQMLEDLCAVRELLDRPSRWTKGAFARNDAGVVVSPLSENAVCWCLLGAMHKVTGLSESRYEDLVRALDMAKPRIPWLGCLNEYAKHEEILELIDRAIVLGKSVD